jgi:hypothetical protein
MTNTQSLLNESDIPKHMLVRSRNWFAAQVQRLEVIHGEQWEDHKEWIASYLNAEVKELVEKNT